jgi:hypothetical protein
LVTNKTNLKLASCSNILWLLKSFREKVVAFGVGFVVIALVYRNVERLSSTFKAFVNALMVAFRSIFLPSCGRKPWFAKLLSIGQGARTTESGLSKDPFGMVHIVKFERRGHNHTVVWPWRAPCVKVVPRTVCKGSGEDRADEEGRLHVELDRYVTKQLYESVEVPRLRSECEGAVAEWFIYYLAWVDLVSGIQ